MTNNVSINDQNSNGLHFDVDSKKKIKKEEIPTDPIIFTSVTGNKYFFYLALVTGENLVIYKVLVLFHQLYLCIHIKFSEF